MSTAVLRARQVLSGAGLAHGVGPLERVDSAFNEVWLAGPYVLRISASVGTRRLEHEIEVARMLPPGVRYPPIITYGRTAFLEWLVLGRVPGQVLSRAWPGMPEESRREAVHQLGRALHELHGVTPPDGLWPPFLEGDTLECPHQLPCGRVLQLVDRASRLAHVDRGLIDHVGSIVRSFASAFDDDGPAQTMVHGDLHLENVLWDGEQVTLLDFEWARPAPPDLDLDVLLRFCADPSLHVAFDYGHLARAADYGKVPRWLREAYPGLFSHPRLKERLTVYTLSYDLRALLLQPPDGPVSTLPPHHPLSRIARTVEGRTHLAWAEW